MMDPRIIFIQKCLDECRLEDAGILGDIDPADFMDRHPELIGKLTPSYPPDWTDEDAERHAWLEKAGIVPAGLFPNGLLYKALVSEGLMPAVGPAAREERDNE